MKNFIDNDFRTATVYGTVDGAVAITFGAPASLTILATLATGTIARGVYKIIHTAEATQRAAINANNLIDELRESKTQAEETLKYAKVCVCLSILLVFLAMYIATHTLMKPSTCLDEALKTSFSI